MRVVLDTNVVMSGIFFGGPPGRILDAWSQGRFELVLSPEILAEYREVGVDLAGRYPMRATALAPVLALIAMNATLVTAAPLPHPISTDPDDDVFLATALAANARILVSGDRDLLRVSGVQGVDVRTPRQFVTRYLGTDT